jgi:putative component of toxin-antitoxin plasmid stabilization module
LSFIDSLIENGTNFRVDRKAESASFYPVGNSDADLDAFQSVVRDLRVNEGDGYQIHIAHPVSDRGHGLIDLVLVTFERA